MQKDPGPSTGVAGHSYELALEMIGIIFDLSGQYGSQTTEMWEVILERIYFDDPK